MEAEEIRYRFNCLKDSERWQRLAESVRTSHEIEIRTLNQYGNLIDDVTLNSETSEQVAKMFDELANLALAEATK